MLDPLELSGRKLLALFDRAAARDFVDVFALAKHFDPDELVGMAMAMDPGFELKVLVSMFKTLERFSDDDLPSDPFDVSEIRTFFANWSSRIQQQSSPTGR